MSLDDRVARIERDIAYLRGSVEQMDKRLARLENDVVHLREEVGKKIEEVVGRVEEANRRVDSLFRWTIGFIFGMWTSIMLINTDIVETAGNNMMFHMTSEALTSLPSSLASSSALFLIAGQTVSNLYFTLLTFS